MSETSAEVVERYLRDALSSEKHVQVLFSAFAGESVAPPVKDTASNCAELSRRHQEQLEARLASLAGGAPDPKGLLARVLERPTGVRETKNKTLEGALHDLIEPFAATHSLIATYEALAIMGDAASDTDTAALARLLQREQQVIAEQLSTAIRAQCLSSPSKP